MKKTIALGSIAVCLIMLASVVSAIPEEDLYRFTGAGRFTFKFDDYYNSSAMRTAKIRFITNHTNLYYYIVIRANIGDSPPYDSFDVSFICNGDESETAFTTTDYSSWVESGQISFKRRFSDPHTVYYMGVFPFQAMDGECNITSATNLQVEGNEGYTTFNVELVPLLDTNVKTVQSYCEERARTNLIETEINETLTVITSNLNIFTTLWIVIQIFAVILLVIGLPFVIFMMIRWAVYKVTGHKIFARGET